MKNHSIASLLERISSLERENAELKKEVEDLKEVVEFHRLTPTQAQGRKGETFIATLTRGVRTGYREPHDVTVNNGDRLEVKMSRVTKPNSYTRRWNWHNVLGSGHNKEYEFLILLGEKDPVWRDQYPPDLQYVIFLVPRSDVDHIKTGNQIAINTNLARVRAKRSLALKRYLVMDKDGLALLTSLGKGGDVSTGTD